MTPSSSAPVAGKLMAELIDYCEDGHDNDTQPLQFHLERIDRNVNAGFCSRLGEMNSDSSFSVLG
jgi:sarcosine oxidase subunit beta